MRTELNLPFFSCVEQRGVQHWGQDQGVLAARTDLRRQDHEDRERLGRKQVAKVLCSLPGMVLCLKETSKTNQAKKIRLYL